MIYETKEDQERLHNVVTKIMVLMQKLGPEMACDAMNIAHATVIMFATRNQNDALEELSSSVEKMVHLVDTYPENSECHWEHED